MFNEKGEKVRQGRASSQEERPFAKFSITAPEASNRKRQARQTPAPCVCTTKKKPGRFDGLVLKKKILDGLVEAALSHGAIPTCSAQEQYAPGSAAFATNKACSVGGSPPRPGHMFCTSYNYWIEIRSTNNPILLPSAQRGPTWISMQDFVCLLKKVQYVYQ